MASSLSFAEFMELLPSEGGAPPLVSSGIGVDYVSDANPCFVEPSLSAGHPVRADTSVILLSAPGAVGKSTVASELARRTHATLWNLAQFQVGSNTFTGTLTRAFGAASGAVLTGLASGKSLVVLDAIDEAAVRAGSQNRGGPIRLDSSRGLDKWILCG